MNLPPSSTLTRRYEFVPEEKAGGATYTPKELADFVAVQIVQAAEMKTEKSPLKVLDPAVGQGQLLESLLEQLPRKQRVEVYGFDTNGAALNHTSARLQKEFPNASIHLKVGNFLNFVLDMCTGGIAGALFRREVPETYDLIIANPPYVRTQVMGSEQARQLAAQFGLSGRVDLYYAFILGIAKVLRPHGIAGIIVSNRFMTTKAGVSVRQAIRREFNLRHIWDLGDTKLFNAAVLPAVLLVEGRNDQQRESVTFTSTYETKESSEFEAQTVVDALEKVGVIRIADGRRFRVQQGKLDESGGIDSVWRIATKESGRWIATVKANTWRSFGDIGRIHVGVKTCADKVFISTDWDKLPESERPELLRPLATHHIARQFKADNSKKQRYILYPHESAEDKRRTVDLEQYPRSKAYLEQHRKLLERRTYVLAAGRNWYEIWVPQDPAAWDRTKLVFRDISERPCFWIDQAHSVVNGDCYWLICDREGNEDLLWLAVAVGNSSFIEVFYDHLFHNKLYAGRRRFMTQYVEKFPLPKPTTEIGKGIIAQAKNIYQVADKAEASYMKTELDHKVWKAFGLDIKEIMR